MAETGGEDGWNVVFNMGVQVSSEILGALFHTYIYGQLDVSYSVFRKDGMF